MELYRASVAPGRQKVCEILRTDAAMCAKLLQLANSSFCASGQPVTKISEAVKVLGESNVPPLVLGMTMASVFNKSNFPAEDRDPLWQASLQKAIVAEEWARITRESNLEEAFLGALFQDVAVPVLIASDRAASMELGCVLEMLDGSRTLRESNMYGADHCEFGARFARHLGLPEFFAAAIATHHHPQGPVLPEQFQSLAPALRLAASLPHRATRFDDHCYSRLTKCLRDPMYQPHAAKIEPYLEQVVATIKSVTVQVGDPAERPAMRNVLQDAADLISRTLFEAVGYSHRTIALLLREQSTLKATVSQLQGTSGAAQNPAAPSARKNSPASNPLRASASATDTEL
jgi:HD-like signal output (HDOD) protein